MRAYQHDIDEDVLEEHYYVKRVHYRTRTGKAAMAKAKGDSSFFSDRHTEARQLAAMAWALEAEPEAVGKWLDFAVEHSATAIELGAVPHCFVHMTWLALAVLRDRPELRARLADLEPASTERTPKLFLHTADAWRHLVAGRGVEARAALTAGAELLDTDQSGRDARDVMTPYLKLMEAIVSADGRALEQAVRSADGELASNFDDTLSVDADGLIDFIGLGMLQRAAEAGLTPPATSTYLPAALLRSQ